jgi:anti-anti-sigma factor
MDYRRIAVEERGAVTVVTLCDNELTEQKLLDELRGEILSFADTMQPRMLVVDFARVSVLSSEVMGILIRLRRNLESVGGELILCGMTPAIEEVFRISNLRDYRIVPDLAAALEQTAAPA